MASAYDRKRDIPRLIPCLASALNSTEATLQLLRHALAVEHGKAMARHWTYDPARHSAILAAYREECARDVAERGAVRSLTECV